MNNAYGAGGGLDDNFFVIGGTRRCNYQKLKTESYYDANFIVTDVTARWLNENQGLWAVRRLTARSQSRESWSREIRV